MRESFGCETVTIFKKCLTPRKEIQITSFSLISSQWFTLKILSSVYMEKSFQCLFSWSRLEICLLEKFHFKKSHLNFSLRTDKLNIDIVLKMILRFIHLWCTLKNVIIQIN